MAGELTRVILKTTLGLTLSHTGEDAADVNYEAKCIHNHTIIKLAISSNA